MTKVNGSNKQTSGKHETSHADRRTAIWTADRLGVSNRKLKLRRVEAGNGYAMTQRSDREMDQLRVNY